ncbi:MAG: hypothetical protein HZC36_08790 [Armatimonadetes bacterium]|nr:hypothetical protein [Armatimonadota bacterium]
MVTFIACAYLSSVALAFLPEQHHSYRIAGIELGMSSAAVVGVLGIPESKSGPLASRSLQTASWKSYDLWVRFDGGKVVAIVTHKPNPKTSLVDVGKKIGDAVAAYGEPTDILNEPLEPSELAKSRNLFFQDCLIRYACDADQTITEVGLDQRANNAGKKYKADRLPDYRLSIEGLKWYQIPRQSDNPGRGHNPGNSKGVEAQGLVINRRTYEVNVTVSIRVYDTYGKLYGESSQGMQSVKPGEFRSFSIRYMRSGMVIGNVVVTSTAPLRDK